MSVHLACTWTDMDSTSVKPQHHVIVAWFNSLTQSFLWCHRMIFLSLWGWMGLRSEDWRRMFMTCPWKLWMTQRLINSWTFFKVSIFHLNCWADIICKEQMQNRRLLTNVLTFWPCCILQYCDETGECTQPNPVAY